MRLSRVLCDGKGKFLGFRKGLDENENFIIDLLTLESILPFIESLGLRIGSSAVVHARSARQNIELDEILFIRPEVERVYDFLSSRDRDNAKLRLSTWISLMNHWHKTYGSLERPEDR